MRARHLVFSLLAAGVAAATADAQSFTIRRLTGSGLGNGTAWEVDNSNRIVGELLNGGGIPQPVVWLNGTATTLPLHSGGSDGSARTIDDSGVIGGLASNTASAYTATTWQPVTSTTWSVLDMGFLSSTFAGVVNGLRGGSFAVGYSDDAIFTYPVVWPSDAEVGSPIALPCPAAQPFGEARDVTASQVVLGHVAGTAAWPTTWAFGGGTWTGTQLPTLSGATGGWGMIDGVVANNHFTGTSISPSTGREHLVEWVNGAITDLGTITSQDCHAEDANTGGDIVGWSRTYASPPYVAIWKLAGGPIEVLDTLLPPQSGWQLARAWGINNAGVIVGQGVLGGFGEAFAMIPTTLVHLAPSPGTPGPNTFTVSGAQPGNTVEFFVSTSGGEAVVPGCLEALDIASPLSLGTATANGSGVATLNFTVPGSVAGVPFLLQAYEGAACHTSNVVPHTF